MAVREDPNMTSKSVRYIFALLMLFCSAASGLAQAGEGSAVSASAMEGLWLRPMGGDGGGQGGKEGFYLHADGTLELVGIASMNGLDWKVRGNELVLTTNTDRYPDPVAVKYTVGNLTGKSLAIKADDYLSGTFDKEDPASSAALRDWRAAMNKLYIDNAVEYMKYVDGSAAQYKKAEKTLEPETKGLEKRKVELWTVDGKPVKLTLSGPGSGAEKAEIYYLDGAVKFCKGPFSGYVFKNGRLALEVDADMKPVEGITDEEMKKTGSAIVKSSKDYLALFNSGT